MVYLSNSLNWVEVSIFMTNKIFVFFRIFWAWYLFLDKIGGGSVMSKLEKSISFFAVCLCAHLSLSLQYARISRAGHEKMRLVLSDSLFTLHAQRAKYRYDMDIIWIIVGAICLLVGLAGCFLPALPGPPLSYVGMILLHLTDKVQFTATQLIVWAHIGHYCTGARLPHTSHRHEIQRR